EDAQHATVEECARGADKRHLAHVPALVEKRDIAHRHQEIADQRNGWKQVRVAGERKDNHGDQEQSEADEQNAPPRPAVRFVCRHGGCSRIHAERTVYWRRLRITSSAARWPANRAPWTVA